jgi:hypothetical protein
MKYPLAEAGMRQLVPVSDGVGHGIEAVNPTSLSSLRAHRQNHAEHAALAKLALNLDLAALELD